MSLENLNETFYNSPRNEFLANVEESLNIKFLSYQKEFVLAVLNGESTVLCAGRGCGKTYAIALAAISLALNKPGTKIAVFAPSFRQTGYVLDEVIQLSIKYLVAKNSFSVTFENGSTIIGLPLCAMDREHTRKTLIPNDVPYDYYFCEETFYFDEEALEHITNILRHKNVSYTICPRPKEEYYDWFGALTEVYKLIRTNVFNLATELPFDLKFIFEQMNSISKEEAICEWLGLFPQELKENK